MNFEKQVKKQREADKREQQAGVPPEYISYRHFSIQSGEAGQAARQQAAAAAATTLVDSQPPSFITSASCPGGTPNL